MNHSRRQFLAILAALIALFFPSYARPYAQAFAAPPPEPEPAAVFVMTISCQGNAVVLRST